MITDAKPDIVIVTTIDRHHEYTIKAMEMVCDAITEKPMTIYKEKCNCINARYSRGALMSYSLTAHSPYEGFKLAINGSEGRIEAETFHGVIGPFAGEELTD